MSALKFQEITLHPVQRKGQFWLTINDLTRCLYKRVEQNVPPFVDGRKRVDQIGLPLPGQIRTVQQLYQRHADEFTSSMTRIVRVQTNGGAQDVRAFSLRGAHLLAMFARTPIAKDFRRWALDILDKEVSGAPSAAVTLTEGEAANLYGALHMAAVHLTQERLEPVFRALRAVGSPFAPQVFDLYHEVGFRARMMQDITKRCRALYDRERSITYDL